MKKVGRKLGRTLIGVSASALALAYISPAMAQDAAAQDETVQDEAQDEGGIVVTGQRASDRASLLAKRDSDRTTEVVSANDVGKLPDQNVAEAVRRLSGVSVATDKGEGRYLIIRGIEPNLANVTLNGQTSAAPEPSDRNVKLDDIPSGLIGKVTVIKTLTPDLDANAIAGQVDIDTVSAFDKKGSIFASARGVMGFYEDTDRRAREGDVSVGGRFGPDQQFGLVIAGNYSKRPSYSEDVLSSGRQIVGGIDLPVEMDQRIYDPAIRTRKGAVANFDWRPSDAVKLYARFLYSQFDDNEVRNRLRFIFPTAATGYSNLTANGGTITRTTARRLLRARHETTDTKTYSVGGEFEIGPGKLVVQGTYSNAKKTDPSRDEIEYRAPAGSGATALGATFTMNADGMPTSFTANAAALDPANYRLNSYKQASRISGEKMKQARFDYTLPIGGLDEGSTIQFGAKYLHRDRFEDRTGRTLTAITATSGTRTFADTLATTIPTIFDGAYSFGPTLDMAAARNYVFSNTALFTINANDQISQSKTSDYKVDETVTAAYAMATIKSGGLTVIPGVRMEHTKGNTAAIVYRAGVTSLTSTYDSFGHYSYTDFFPGVNLKYELNRNLQARAAVTTAMGRPPFANLAPTVTVDVPSNTVSQGNPNLKPQYSFNLDAGLEYYFPNEGGVSVAVFYKHLTNPIFATTALNQSGTFGGVALTGATVNSFGNGTTGSVKGIEFAIQKPFTFLPSPLDGLGVNANLTLTDSDLKVINRTIHTPLVGQANTIASAQLYYEKYGISARVALSYHSAYLDTDGGLNEADPTGAGDGYFGANTTIDARIGYRPVKYLEVFVEGNNLTDAQDYYYYQTPSRWREGEKYGRSVRVGLTFTY